MAEGRTSAPLDTMARRALTTTSAWVATAVEAGGDPVALHAAALIDLRWGEVTGRVARRAAEQLAAAAPLSADNASVLSDLAAAYLVVAGRGGDARALLQAIDASERAVAADSTYLPALFNRALALHRAAFISEGARAARDYLSRDSTTGWADAVRALGLGAPAAFPAAAPNTDADSVSIARFVAGDHQRTREHGFEFALRGWGACVLIGDSIGAERHLRLAERLGATLVADGGDASLLDASAALRALPRGGGVGSQRASAVAYQALAEALDRYRRRDYALARAAAERVLSVPGLAAPVRAWARVVLGGTLVHAGEWKGGERTLRLAIAGSDSSRHPALMGRAHASLGTSIVRRGLDDAADAEIARAEHFLSRAREELNLGAVQSERADALLIRGETDGYAVALRTLQTLRRHPHIVWRHNILYVLAEEALADGWPYAAALAQDEGVAAATGSGDSLDLAEALLARARLRVALGDRVALTRDVERARGLIDAAPPGPDRDWLEADLRLSEAAAMLRDRPHDAVRLADAAVAFFRARENVVRLAPAFAMRAEARAAAGELGSALADLVESATLLDSRAARMASVGSRTLLLSDARRVLGSVVSLQLAKGDSVGALVTVERTRALLSADPSARATVGRRRLALAPSETGVAYFRIADTLLIWTVRDATVSLVRRTIDAARLVRLLLRTRAALELRRPDSVTRPLLAELHETLVEPVRERLGSEGGDVVIASDGELAAIPFAALYDRRRGRYMAQEHKIRIVRTLAEGGRGESSEWTRGSALLVADPAFDMGEHPALDRLPGAVAEVAAIAPAYPTHQLLQGDEARRDALAVAFSRASVVHYAGHAVYDAARPERSYLVLAPSPPHGDRATARIMVSDVTAMRLGHVRLVVLSACQTFGSVGEAIGGSDGLAGAFRAAGVRGVVGSAWRVDDALTQPMMIEFHRLFAESGDGPRALREAQLRMLRDPSPALRSPSAWGAFLYAGR